MAFEFYNQNIINTTTQISVDSGTDTVSFLYDGAPGRKYSTENYNSNTSTILNFSLSAATVISNIMLVNHNLKQFRVFYNGATANSLYSSSTNSNTSTYISFNSITVSSVQVQLDAAITSGEKQIGELFIVEKKFGAIENPDISGFNPILYRKQIKHNMPDGGTVLYNIREKYRVQLKYDYLSYLSYPSIKSLYDDGSPFVFNAFPTTTGWDGNAHEMVWVGPFNFKYSFNEYNSVYEGTMELEQTANV